MIELVRRQLTRPADHEAPALRCLHPFARPFPDQLTLEFGKGGENSKDQFRFRPRRVDGGPLAGQHLQTDASRLQGFDQADQIER